MRPLQVRHLLLVIALASLLCAAIRALVILEPIGILCWPVLLGAGTDRLLGGRGVWGGTLGGLMAFEGVVGLVFFQLGGGWSHLVLVSILAFSSGICWGFYLSVWVYMIVETLLQYR